MATEPVIINVQTTGMEKILQLDQSLGTLAKVLALIRGEAAGFDGLADLDAKLKISDTTLGSYNRLLRLMSELQTREEKLASLNRKIATNQAAFEVNPTAANSNGGFGRGAEGQGLQDNAVRTRNNAVDAQREAVANEILRLGKADAAAIEKQRKSDEQIATDTARRAVLGQQAIQRLREGLNDLRLSQVDENVAQRPVVNYPGAIKPQNAQGQFRPRTAVEQAQVAKDTADTELKRANLALAAERRNSARDEASLDAVMKRQLQASKDVTAAGEKLAEEERLVAVAEAARKQASRLAAVDAQLAQRSQAYPNADVTTHVGRAQSAVNAADDAVEAATRRLAAERNSETVTADGVRAAERSYEAATASAAAARERLALLQTRGSGSLAQQFKTGFHGTNSDRSYAEQIGQAFKFSVFYGTAYRLLSGITETMQATLQEAINFQQSMTELSIASGRSADSLTELSRNLGQSSVEAGFAPSQGVLVGARSLGLFGAAAGSGATQAEQDRIAETSARVVSRIALGSGQQPADIQSNISAISQAFETGAEGLTRSYDLDAFFSKKFGVPAGSTLAGASEAGTVGKSAGFSQDQVQAIAAQLQSRVGVGPEAVAGYMAQIFSRAGEGSLVKVDQQYGVDPNSSLRDQLDKLARVYARNPEARDDIAAVGGRGKVQSAFIAMLQDWQEIQKQVRASRRGESDGAGDNSFNQRLKNIGGQIALTVGALRDFASALGGTGLLEVVGLVVVGFRDLVEAATKIIRVWNSLGDTTHRVAEGLVALLLAARITTGGNLLTSAGRATALSGGTGLFASGGGAHTGPGALAGNAKSLGLAALVLGDVYLWASLHDATKKLTDAQDATADLLNAGLDSQSTPDQFRARATALSDQAKQDRDAQSGILPWLTSGKYGLNRGTSDALDLSSAQADAEAKRLNALARLHEKVDANSSPSQALVAGFDTDSLTSSLQGITDSGGTAQDRLDALNATLLGTAGAADRLASAFNPELFAGDVTSNVYSAITGSTSLSQTDVDWFANPLTHGLIPKKTTDVGPQRIAAALSSDQVNQRLQSALAGISDPSQLSGRKLGQVADSVIRDTPDIAFKDMDPKEIEKARRQMRRAVIRVLQGEVKTAQEIIHGGHRLSGSELTAVITAQTATTQDLLNSLPQTDLKGRAAANRHLVQDILGYIRHAKRGTDLDGAQQQLDNARHAVVDAQISRLEGLRRAAQHMAKTDAEVKSIGRSFFSKELARAVRGGSRDAIVGLVNNAGDWSIAIAKKAVQDAIAAARAAISMEADVIAFARNEMAGLEGFMHRPGVTGGGPTAKVDRRIKELQSQLAGLSEALPGGKDNNYDTGGDANRPDAAAADDGSTAAQIAAARQSALASGSESGIAQARAAMATARADMAAAKKGTVEYYSALGAYLDARNQLTDAILDYRNNKYLLGHDITNPLVQARAALIAARAKLHSDKGKPDDVRAADKVALQQAQADAEAAAFQQRLDAVQTAEQLGRMSYGAYINYLNHERDRLKGIAHRSYQQQQELNQVDQLLKTAADQMQGQWNFGDIKLPTPYQVRRYIETHRGGGDGNGNGDNHNPSHGGGGGDGNGPNAPHHNQTVHNVNIHIDGADTGQILRILRRYVGQSGRTMTTGTRHR